VTQLLQEVRILTPTTMVTYPTKIEARPHTKVKVYRQVKKCLYMLSHIHIDIYRYVHPNTSGSQAATALAAASAAATWPVERLLGP
jgi:hypothetical protein